MTRQQVFRAVIARAMMRASGPLSYSQLWEAPGVQQYVPSVDMLRVVVGGMCSEGILKLQNAPVRLGNYQKIVTIDNLAALKRAVNFS